ncbi:V-set and transmembrane domain-containing protein 1 isoform X2 [Neophocaena asiaeorientalis asiaeorientalis]|uniref:V-set and transmembrane domain-containing protein 1 isoform X2 n=1 Tax=Neophocaena asiaeorientalis asiaeorientalis TaxID=1706337 RepID=A0A341B8J8_NEOAA|nr:V-set and transmembrane domain-containing protein 1 isoform X2 [Neophocaena asiaeorientalis asiaeorientalis]
MITEFLSLLHLGLCLGNEDEKNYGEDDESGRDPAKTDTKVIFVVTFCCLSVFLLFIIVFLIYRCTRHDSSHEESAKRTSHSKFPKQGAEGVSKLERISESPEESQGVTYVKLNTNALSAAASVPTKEPAGSCDYATLKV